MSQSRNYAMLVYHLYSIFSLTTFISQQQAVKSLLVSNQKSHQRITSISLRFCSCISSLCLSLSLSLSLSLFLVTIVTYPIQLSMKTHRSPYQLSFRNNLELKSLTPFVTNLQGEFSIEHQPNHEVYILISHNGQLKTTPMM